MNSLIRAEDRLFVAGAFGMAGSAICRSLQAKGYGDVAKGGLLLTPNRRNLDLLDGEAVDVWFKKHKPDVVVLAAAKVGGIYANDIYPADFLMENIKIQTHVIESAWRSGVRRLLFLGSSCIYPKFAEQPIKEEALLSGSLEPTNEWYAIAKIAGIKLCEALRQQYGFDAISVMPTNLYGPGDNYHPENSHVLPALIRRFHEAVESNAASVTCWGSGNPLRELLHVDDLADACVFVLEHWSPSSKSNSFVNVGTGVDHTIRELAEIVAGAFGYRGKIFWDTSKSDGAPRKQLDISKLLDLGWSPKISLEEGIEMTISQYKADLENNLLRSR